MRLLEAVSDSINELIASLKIKTDRTLFIIGDKLVQLHHQSTLIINVLGKVRVYPQYLPLLYQTSIFFSELQNSLPLLLLLRDVVFANLIAKTKL